MSQQTTTLKTRRNRLSPYTAAERRMKKTVVIHDGDPIAMRHLERGIGRKSFGKKSQM
jgi:hypothetical protein